MSVRTLQEVVPEQVTPTLLAAVFVFGSSAFVLVHAINNLWLVATTPVNTIVEWMATWLIAVVAIAMVLLSLKLIDRELEVGA